MYIMFFLQLISANKTKGGHNGSKEECTQITNLCEKNGKELRNRKRQNTLP